MIGIGYRNPQSFSTTVSVIQRISLFILYTQCIIFAVNHGRGSGIEDNGSGVRVSSSFLVKSTTDVKWTANQDPNAPLASKVPRSQKYWDENNIERPDYAKTDAEIAAERKKDGNTNVNESNFSYVKLLLRISIGVVFLILWTGIYQFGMGGGKGRGTRLGSSNSAGSSSTSSGNILLNYSARVKNSIGGNTITYTESLEEKARKARLARFESIEKSKDE